jgi:ABC-2 type transport system permease protein
MMTANFLKYTRFVIRRDRFNSSLWLGALAAFALLLAAMYPGMFPDMEAMQGMLATINTPPMIAMMGPVYGVESITPAIMLSQNCLIWIAIAVIIMNIFFVNRYTRVDEELGRLEMLISLPVGRLTDSFVMIFLSFVLNIAVALLIALFTLATGIEGGSTAGALAYGLSIGMQGFLFAMLTLLSAQLFSTARASMSVAFALMGVFYMLRAYGDMNDNIFSYISPMGLGLKVEAFYSNNFLPIVILFIEALVIAAIALWVNARRDTGMGVFPARKGKAHASRALKTPLGFAWRLLRGGFIAWAIGIFAIGASYGSVVGELDNFVEGNEAIRQMLEGTGGAATLVDAFVAMLSCITALLICIPLISSISRLQTEEKRGRLEPIMATSVSRKTIFGCFILIAALEAIALTFLGVLGLYAAASSTGLIAFGTLTKAAFAYLPALFVMIGLATFFVGLLPKLKSLVWLLFGYSFIMFYFGRLFKVPEIAIKLTPFGNIPQLPIEQFSVLPLVVLCVIAIGLTVGGVLGFERRDIKS